MLLLSAELPHLHTILSSAFSVQPIRPRLDDVLDTCVQAKKH